MGRLVGLSIFFLLVTCKPETVENKSNTQDSLKIVSIKKAYEFRHKLDSLEHVTNDSILLEKIQYYKDKSDASVWATINYKGAQVRSYYFEDQLEEVRKNVEVLTKQVKEYQTRYEASIVAEENLKHKLSSEVEKHKATTAIKDKLQEDVKYASELRIADVRIEGIGKNILGKEIKTFVASKIDYFNYYYTLAENKLAVRETKKILIIMISSDGKDSIERETEVDYVGNKITEKIILSGKHFTPGSKQITIYINGELKDKTLVTLK